MTETTRIVVFLGCEIFPHERCGAAVSNRSMRLLQDEYLTELIIFSNVLRTLKSNGSFPFSSQEF
jgi:hypothetical protein